MKISACVIAKNEEKNIANCLNSVQTVVDEMIVVDTGSSDDTVLIAKQQGATVYSFQWKNNFAAAKNFALEKACGQWVIFLDADEFFSEESRSQIKKTLYDLENENIDAVMCQILNIDADANNRLKDTFSAIRIFRKAPEIYYKNAIHEELIHNKRMLRIVMLVDILKIYHTGYSSSIVKGKLKRNLAILLSEMEKSEEKEKYYRYLCDCYHGLEEYGKAVEYAKLHIFSKKNRSLHSESTVYLKMLYALTKTNTSFEEIQEEFKRTIALFETIPDFYAQYANFLFDQKFYTQAIFQYQKAIEIYKTKKDSKIASAFAGHLPAIYCNLGNLFLIKNEPEKAMECFCEVLLQNKFDAYAFQNFYATIARYPAAQVIALLNSLYQSTQKELQFLVQNLQGVLLTEVYVYYANLLKKESKMEAAITVPYELLALKKYDKLFQHSLQNLDKMNEKSQDEARHTCQTSIIVLTHNQLEYTKLCIESIRRYTEEGMYEIIVVDQNSTDGTIAWLKEQKDIQGIFNQQLIGFSKSCNQGIRTARGKEIVFLANDTIVTECWLHNLRIALYSDEMVSAVGPVTNHHCFEQKIETNYENSAQLQIFAASFNHSDPDKWEEKIKLAGFCFVIKRSVIEQIGGLDELFAINTLFTISDLESADYSLRMIQAGYRLLLCKDSFVHWAGSIYFQGTQQAYQYLLNENVQKFKDKWGFDVNYSANCRNDMIGFMNIKQQNIKVLEVGCACGATLLKIKQLNKSAEVYGIELCEETAAISKHFAEVTAENIECTELSYEPEMFDYILFGDVLEHLYQPQRVLEMMKKYLKPGGSIIASLPNVMHISVVKDLLRGNWTYQDAGILDKTHVRFFTYNEIVKMFHRAGFTELDHKFVQAFISQEEKTLLDKLVNMQLVTEKEMFLAYQYIFQAQKPLQIEEKVVKDELQCYDDKPKLKFLLRRIEYNIDVDVTIRVVGDRVAEKIYTIQDVMQSIQHDVYQKTKVAVLITTDLLRRNMHAQALEILLELYKLYPQEAEVVCAFARMLILTKNKESALSVLKNFKGEDERVTVLISEIGAKNES